MIDPDAAYDIQERTDNPDHVSVAEICDRILTRAADPRADPPNEHLDNAMATAVDQYGEAAVRQSVHRILVDHVPFRTAAADLELRSLDGGRIGTVAGQVLRDRDTAQNE